MLTNRTTANPKHTKISSKMNEVILYCTQKNECEYIQKGASIIKTRYDVDG